MSQRHVHKCTEQAETLGTSISVSPPLHIWGTCPPSTPGSVPLVTNRTHFYISVRQPSADNSSSLGSKLISSNAPTYDFYVRELLRSELTYLLTYYLYCVLSLLSHLPQNNAIYTAKYTTTCFRILLLSLIQPLWNLGVRLSVCLSVALGPITVEQSSTVNLPNHSVIIIKLTMTDGVYLERHYIITAAKEIMFSLALFCLFVC